jgi:undecaprenyl diphosphate synthase
MKIIGRRDRIPAELLRAIVNAETATREGRTLELRIAVDYSSREAILRAARRLPQTALESGADRAEFAHLLAQVDNGIGESRDVDLLIRTGGEQRLSDFLLWECAYAELYFTRRMWPEFSPQDLHDAVEEFHARERRFGAVPAAAAG